MNEMKFYDVNPLLELGCTYSISFGERSAGKTYSALKAGIKMVVDSDYKKQFAYMRRLERDIKGSIGSTIFAALIANNEIAKVTKDKWNTVYYKSQAWYFANKDKEGNITEKAAEPFCWGFALNLTERYKGNSYPNICYIVFDEFIAMQHYINNEFFLFQNMISTIVRYRDDVKILLLGNTISKDSLYFHELGIYKIVKYMEPGETKLIKNKESKLTMAVEFTFHNENGKPSDVYFEFDNGSAKMITDGAWEISRYPLLDPGVRIRPMDIIYKFYIVLYDEIFQANVISKNNSNFLFIHNKTTPLKEEDNDLIFSLEYNTKDNYRRDILRPVDELGKKIAWFFKADKVFYSSNVVGDAINTYLSNLL